MLVDGRKPIPASQIADAGTSTPGDVPYWPPTKTDVGLGNVTNDVQTKASVVPNTAPSAGQMLIGDGTKYNPTSPTTANVPDSTDKRYCTDSQKTVLGNTSGTNSGDETAARLATLGNDCLITGTALTDADETIHPANVAKSRFVLAAGTASAARIKTIGTTGSPMLYGTVCLRIEPQTYSITIRNGGTNGTGISDYVLAAQATAVDIVAAYDGSDWQVHTAVRVQ